VRLTHQFEKSVLFPNPVDEVFLYHACIDNICRLVPGYININIIDAPCSLKLEDKIRLKVYMYHIPFYWESTIIDYQQNVRFTDSLKRGPFSLWRHYHLFEPHKEGTLMIDRIEYKLPFSVFGEVVNYFLVKDELGRIFTTRHKKALEHFSSKN
jgi:ligand-binding SRPBCC domain-containing protein